MGYNNSIYWNGDTSSLWDINTSPNWQFNGTTGLTYYDTNQVVFDDTATGNFAVTLNTLVKPISVTVNSTNSYSLGGSGGIGGGTALNKSGTGLFTLNNANTYTGLTTVSAGTLLLTNLNAIPAGNSLNIATGAVVQPKAAGTYASVTTTLNGSGTAGGSFGGSLDFHGGNTTTWPGQIILNLSLIHI